MLVEAFVTRIKTVELPKIVLGLKLLIAFLISGSNHNMIAMLFYYLHDEIT